MVNKIAVVTLVIGLQFVASCGQGPGYLGLGLAIEDFLDPDEGVGEDGQNGLACYDLNANGECDEEEDVNGDGFCDAVDCRGSDGNNGVDGDDGTDGSDGSEGKPGPKGPPGPTTVIVVEPPDEPDDSAPPFGHGPDGNGPPGHRP